MTGPEFVQTYIYPPMGLLVLAAVGYGVAKLKAMTTIAQATADGPALTGAIQRAHALAQAQNTPAASIPAKVAEYLRVTSPELAVRTGVLMPEDAAAPLAPTPAGEARIAATIAAPAGAP